MSKNKIASATRFFIADPSRVSADRAKITRYVDASLACSRIERLYIAVDPHRDVASSIDFLRRLPTPAGKRVEVMPVTPWGRYVEPLNALALQAAFDGYSELLFANTEHIPTDANVRQLSDHLDSSTLVAGAALDVFHEFEPGEHRMNGVRVPSDAFMLVNLELFTLFGFITVSEAPWVPHCGNSLGTPKDPGMLEAGMKEVATFSLIQHFVGREKAQVKLAAVAGAERDTSTIVGDRKRLDDHKRASAIQRAEAQMRRTNIPYGYVKHIA